MAVDPSIAMGFQPTTAAISDNPNALISLVQQSQQKKQQNALRQILSQPGATDPATGLPTPQAIQQITKVSPKIGMDLSVKNAAVQQDIEKGKKEDNAIYAPLVQKEKDAIVNEAGPLVKKYGLERATEMLRSNWSAGKQNLIDSGVPKDKVAKIPDLTPALLQNYMSSAITPEKVAEFAEKDKADARADKKMGLDERKESETERKDDALIASLDAKTKAAGGASFTPEMGALMAAMAEKGVSLPAGLRSKAQQAQLYQGLIDRNSGKTPDEIADGVKTGQIEFGAQKKETQTAAAVAGKVEVAQNELKQFIPLVKEASDGVPRGSWVPLNKLVQMADTSISDPKLKQLKIYINSTLNAYDQLAARGGTDAEKRAEVRNLLLSADGPEALNSALQAFGKEAEVAHAAAVKATKVPELEDADKAGGKDKGADKSAKGHTVGDFIIQGGKKYTVTAVDKDGNVTAADEVK